MKKITSSSLFLILVATFFISGISALLYQVSWQRLLFKTVGIDIDSVTIVVSVFMFGLGLGGLAGGRIADKFPQKLTLIYAGIELIIGLYGVLSIYLFDYFGDMTLFVSLSHSLNAIGCFLLLLVPTFCMGMTLPILTIAVNKWDNNIGRSIGALYFSNTIGAALGAFIVPFLLFDYLTISQVILIAAIGNFFISIIIYMTLLDKHGTY